MGLVHSPGGNMFYGGIWANDDEYAGFGDDDAMPGHAYRIFAAFTGVKF